MKIYAQGCFNPVSGFHLFESPEVHEDLIEQLNVSIPFPGFIYLKDFLNRVRDTLVVCFNPVSGFHLFESTSSPNAPS